jgi:hypothetical protein
MKIISLLVLSLSTFAGVPHQDLIVDIMRENFRSATPNLIEYDIELNKDWSCVYYNARAGVMPNFSKYRTLFNFKRNADYSYSNTADYALKNFSFHEEGHFYSENQNDVYLYARKVSKGTLIFEYASPQHKIRKSYISLSNPKLSAHAYIYCKVQ